MILLLDIGNTHTHVGLADARRVRTHADFPTAAWFADRALPVLERFVRGLPRAGSHHRAHAPAPSGVALCSVVPAATRAARRTLRERWGLRPLELTPATLRGLGIDYPQPNTIGPDRLANAVAAFHRYGAPTVVIDFGTAVTFDVVNSRGDYAGGIIAPGLAAMTDYLHEKTALLPRVRIRETRRVIGRSTREAMRIGAVHGYRGLIRGLLEELRRALRHPDLTVIATGGYARLIAARLPEIAAVEPQLTLEGLRLTWRAHHPAP